MKAYSNEPSNIKHPTKPQTEKVKGLDDVVKKGGNVTKRKAPLGIQVHVDYDVSTELTLHARFLDKQKQGNANGASTERSNKDAHTHITLEFKNLSHCPITVNDVYVRQGENILGGRGYKSRITLPIRVKGPRIEVKFLLEENDEKNMTDILIRDTEGNDYICTIKPRKCVNK